MKIMNYWDKVAPFYNLTRRGERDAYERMYELVRKRIVGKEVLELANGTGLIALNTAVMAQRYVATDYSAKMLAQIKEPSIDVLRFEQADATALQYADGEFDVVIMANALHIMPQPNKALLEIARVLRTDGILIAPSMCMETTPLDNGSKLPLCGSQASANMLTGQAIPISTILFSTVGISYKVRSFQPLFLWLM